MISRLCLQCVHKLTFPFEFSRAYNSRTFSTSVKTCDKFQSLKQLFTRFPSKSSGTVRQIKTVTINDLSLETPLHGSKTVGYWLVGCSSMVFGAVILGGVTRLTESGLSMVSWKLMGEKLPLTETEWEAEFEKYKEYPEFKLKNQNISLSEFKWIWWMEYGHRMWGRLLGGVFLVPAAYFWSRGYFSPIMKRRVAWFAFLIGAQGLLGWYMVKSGLEDRFHDPNDVPRVSQYRLAAHLTMAFTLYSFLLWTALDCLLPSQKVKAVNHHLCKLKKYSHASKAMVFFTAISGAFVAGLDAGLVYNSFPKMGDKWIPDDIFAFTPTLRNFTENPTTVQFIHRILGISTVSVVSGMWILSRRCHLSPRMRLAVNTVTAIAWFQVSLGITTLLLYVPISLAALHQSNSLILLSSALWLSHELKHVKRLVK